MVDDRRRPLRDEELARVARAVDPRARATYCAPMLGGVDAATYAVDLDVAGVRRELVVRIHTLPEERDGKAARRYWDAIAGIPAAAPLLIPRGVHLDAEGTLVGLPCLVMTRLSGTPLARPANEDSWIDQLAAALASIHGVDIGGLPPHYRRGVQPAGLVEASLARSAPRHLGDLWEEVATALRSAPTPTPNGMVLTHHDFWFGNTLWSEERLTGIVDWDGARIDDPAFDVAYARGDMALTLGGDAPDRLLARYEARRGSLQAIPFWDLIAVLPAFRWLSDWVEGYREVGRSELTDDVARERLAAFARAALRAL
jgi:aminoglycoside phosphotransferase (APT) family kinase protein